MDSQKHRADKVKHLFLDAEDPAVRASEYSPYFYAEARLDINDVRTGFRETVSLSKALDIYSDSADLLWSNDMIRDVDFRKIRASIPNSVRLGSLPDFVNANFISRMETQFIQYLLRSFTITVHRNFALNIYSHPGESRNEFAARCLDLFNGPKRRELDILHEIFNRRLEQVKEKYLAAIESGGLEQARTESQNKDIFSHYSERIAGLFLQSELARPVPVPDRHSPGMQELEERLSSLELEAQQAIAKLRDSFEEKAQALDEYILHANLKDIHFVRSCILWMPQKTV